MSGPRAWLGAAFAALLVTLLSVCAAPRAACAQTAPTPPLNIAADNVVGTRGPEGDVVLLNGHVRITRGRTVITSERGRYLRAQGMLYLEERVKLVDSTTTITCNQASYSEVQDVLRLEGNVVVVDGEATLKAPWANYDRRLGRAELFGGVDARDKKQTLTADSAVYMREIQLLQARGRVRGIDSQNRLELTGKAIDYDRDAQEAVAFGDPQLVSREEDPKTPPTVIRARRLELDVESRIARARDSVTVERDTLRARADYGEFDDNANYGILTGHPRAWDLETVVTGDTLEMWTSDRHMDRVVVQPNARVDYKGSRPATIGEASLLAGDRIDVYFTNDDIDSLVATGSARNEYQAPPRDGKTAERNNAQGDTITVFFEKRKIDRAVVEGNASGEYHFAVNPADTAAASAERVQYDAAQIEYQVARDKIVLDPKAHLTYRDLELNSRRVEFDLEGQTLVAEGKPELVDRGDKVTGHLMTYDLESRVGNIYQAETEYEEGLYHGGQIRKVNDKELDVMNGSYSTCNLPHPHYRFNARWMKIFLKDKLVAKPVVFYVKRVPLLALPFWVFPIKPGRHSGILFPQFELGFNTGAGQFVRNVGYYWAPNDYMDLQIAGDYYQAEPSWVIRGESQYKLLYKLDGLIYGSYARNEGIGEENWDLDADHTQELSPSTRLVARASFISSRDYNSSDLYGRSIAQRLNRFMTSSIALSHTAQWASFNGVVERRQDLDADLDLEDPDGIGPSRAAAPGTPAPQPNITESFPSLSMALPTRTIGSLPFFRGTAFEKRLASMYVSLDARFLGAHERRGFVATREPSSIDPNLDSITIVQRDKFRRGFQSNASLSDARRAFGWLNLRPSINGSVAVFDRDVLGNRIVPTGVWAAGLASSATFYGTFQPRIGRLEGLRHVIFPNVSLAFSPEFRHLTIADTLGGTRGRFEGFGGIGVAGGEQFLMTFGLDQRLQVKLRNKDQVTRLDNLLSWSMSSSYDFLWQEHGLRHPMRPIGSAIQLQPPKYANASVNFVVDPYEGRPLRALTTYLGLSLSSSEARSERAPDLAVERSANQVQPFRDQWNTALTFSYSGGYSTGFSAASKNWASTRNANAVLSYQLSPSWSAEYSGSYDITARQVGTQRFSIIRDLHCWQAIFTRTFVAGGEAEYYFRLGVKDQQSIFIERGTRGGSLGGIQ